MFGFVLRSLHTNFPAFSAQAPRSTYSLQNPAEPALPHLQTLDAVTTALTKQLQQTFAEQLQLRSGRSQKCLTSQV